MHNKFFGYIRVSTAKQGEHGVSLQEQRDAITRYAERHDLVIARWFEERETAAKRGRPVFGDMLRLLRHGTAAGIVIHKIDRGARNLKDWANLGELIDQGADIRFANETIDLRSRGGRLSADIQAVVAADYVRNLRDEVLKGFYGRIKQGLLPLPAPLGYLDRGPGKPKEIDPVAGPLLRRAFEMYATGRYSLHTLTEELDRLGLRTRRGKPVTRTGFSRILNNPFYIGLIRLRRTGETFQGVHEPLVSKVVFDRVQDVLAGRTPTYTIVHDYLYRRLFSCARCGRSLTGESAKGHVYYRCHTRTCRGTCVAEHAIDQVVTRALAPLRLLPEEKGYLRQKLAALGVNWVRDREAMEQTTHLRLGRVQDRLARLTDAFLDGTIDKPLFEERKAALLMERREAQDGLEALKSGKASLPGQVAELFELAGSASILHNMALAEEKRDLLKIVSSNRRVDGKNVGLMLVPPFSIVAFRAPVRSGGPYRYTVRTLDAMLERLIEWLTSNPTAAFTRPARLRIHGRSREHDTKEWKVAG